MSKSADVIEMFNRYVMPTYAPTRVLTRGKGTRVWDAEGKVYMDFVEGVSAGDFLEVEIIDSDDYDLIARVVTEPGD